MNKPITIRWRLQTLPDAVGVAMLVEQGVLTVEEARFILLKDTGTNGKVEFSTDQKRN